MNDAIHQEGSEHYKMGGVEPIDLYEQGEMLQDFALCSIIKYAYRCRRSANRSAELIVKDMAKIRHYADMVIDLCDDVK
jgi:hypothetical protein